jgi:hypothetical protein
MNTKIGLNSPSFEGLSVHELRAQSNELKQFVAEQSDVLAQRWGMQLDGESDAEFFQGYSEIIGFKSLIQNGWEFDSLSENLQTLCMRAPSGDVHQLLTIALTHERDYAKEKGVQQSLVDNLNLLSSQFRIGIIIREPLQEEQDWNELCMGLGNWLNLPTTQCNSFAYMRKNNPKTWLEFGVSTERYSDEEVVQFAIKPILSSVEWRIILKDIQENITQLKSSLPTIISIVSNKTSNITENHILSLLYGPLASVYGSTKQRNYTFDDTLIPGFFKEMNETNVQSIITFQPTETREFTSRSFLNPTVKSKEVPSPYFGISGEEHIFQWFENK